MGTVLVLLLHHREKTEPRDWRRDMSSFCECRSEGIIQTVDAHPVSKEAQEIQILLYQQQQQQKWLQCSWAGREFCWRNSCTRNHKQLLHRFIVKRWRSLEGLSAKPEGAERWLFFWTTMQAPHCGPALRLAHKLYSDISFGRLSIAHCTTWTWRPTITASSAKWRSVWLLSVLKPTRSSWTK